MESSPKESSEEKNQSQPSLPNEEKELEKQKQSNSNEDNENKNKLYN